LNFCDDVVYKINEMFFDVVVDTVTFRRPCSVHMLRRLTNCRIIITSIILYTVHYITYSLPE